MERFTNDAVRPSVEVTGLAGPLACATAAIPTADLGAVDGECGGGGLTKQSCGCFRGFVAPP